jgi:hypothetical protein
MIMARPERNEFIALAIIAALESDPSGRTVHPGPNPYMPQLNGSFDLLRAAGNAAAALAQWDAAYAVDAAAATNALVPAEQRREAILASLKAVDAEIESNAAKLV